jgi:hypothetical protein
VAEGAGQARDTPGTVSFPPKGGKGGMRPRMLRFSPGMPVRAPGQRDFGRATPMRLIQNAAIDPVNGVRNAAFTLRRDYLIAVSVAIAPLVFRSYRVARPGFRCFRLPIPAGGIRGGLASSLRATGDDI